MAVAAEAIGAEMLEGGAAGAEATEGAFASQASKAMGKGKDFINKYGDGISFATKQVNDSGAGAIIANSITTGIEDYFETDASQQRKQQAKEQQDLVNAEVQDRMVNRQLALQNNKEMQRRQLKKEALQEKLIDREIAGGRALNAAGVSNTPSIDTGHYAMPPPPSYTPQYSGPNIPGLSPGQLTQKQKDKVDKIGSAINEGIDLFRHDGVSKEHRAQKAELAEQERLKMEIKRQKEKRKNSKRKIKEQERNKIESRSLIQQAEEAKKFLRANNALTKKEEEKLDSLSIQKEIMELKRLAEEEKRAIKRKELEDERAYKDAKAAERNQRSIDLAKAKRKVK